jgi:hypothetical protein
MFSYGRVPLADVAGVGKNGTDGTHLFIGKAMDTLELFEQDFILFPERLSGSEEWGKKDQP